MVGNRGAGITNALNLLALGLLFFCNLLAVSAATAIPADLSFTGEYGLDLEINGPAATQSGTFFVRENGIDTPGAYNNDSLTGGVNPTQATLLMHGDGVVGAGDGFGGTAAASIAANTIGPSNLFADTDLGDNAQTEPLRIENSSFSKYYRVFVSLNFTHLVDAFGDDAYARSDIEFHFNGDKLFESEIISDTLFGNEIDGVFTGAFGGVVTQNGLFQFNFLVKPQRFREVELDYTLEGLDNAPLSGLNGNGDYFLSIDDIQAVPLPGALSMFVLMLPVVFGFKRKIN